MNIVPIGERPETPNYKRDLIFDASVNAAARTSLQAQFTAAKALLAKDSSDFNAWLSIGNIRLIGGDAAGAKEIWDYASKVWPTNQVTFNNLGDYYVNYQKDYAKAEANYLIAIKNKPTDPSAYRSLFGLYYTTGYKRTGTTAEDILKKGIAASPSTVDLQVLLARYYRDTGRKTEAKAEFNVAIATAQSSSQSSVVTALQTERDAF
jgi:cytochrome c-type biogenesis protein CcmH/NrfG